MEAQLKQKTGRLDIRITPETRRLLQTAAKERHTTVSQFVLESAIRSANIVLAERTRFSLNDEQWTAFMKALDEPPSRHPRMERLLNEPSVFD